MDNAWKSLQNGTIDFITHNGGSATYYSKQKITARPEWTDVEKYLQGRIDFTELKRRLGC